MNKHLASQELMEIPRPKQISSKFRKTSVYSCYRLIKQKKKMRISSWQRQKLEALSASGNIHLKQAIK